MVNFGIQNWVSRTGHVVNARAPRSDRDRSIQSRLRFGARVSAGPARIGEGTSLFSSRFSQAARDFTERARDMWSNGTESPPNVSREFRVRVRREDRRGLRRLLFSYARQRARTQRDAALIIERDRTLHLPRAWV